MPLKIFKIKLDNQFDADVFSAMLKEECIPYSINNHFSLAYGNIFQNTTGWGHIEVPEEYKEKAEALFKAYKKSLTE
ncbi:MAG: hypothetical protein AB9844_10310 [Clostridiaceae bacterium]